MTYDPDLSEVPWATHEVHAAPMGRATPVIIGSHVQYRHDHHGDVTDALVVEVEDDFPKVIVMDGLAVRIQPWPTVTLDTLYGLLRTRESRVRGSAGWLPLGWEKNFPAGNPEELSA